MNDVATQAPKARILSAALLGLISAAGCGDGAENLFGTTTSSGTGTATSTGQGGATTSTSTSSGDGGATTGQGGSGGATSSTSTSGGTGGSLPGCGDGMKDGAEECDGADLGGKTCKDLGYSTPAGLQCTSCALNAAGCKAVCGNGALEPGEPCDDGNQISGDGCGATCQLEALAGSTCATAIPVSLGLGTITKSGTTAGGGVHSSQGCSSKGPDRIYAVTANANGFLTASLARAQTGYDSVLYASNSCSAGANSDFLCADSHDPQNLQVLKGGEVVSFRALAGTTYYLFVDGPASADAGAFQLVIDLSGGDLCSDPIPIPLEPGTPMRLLGTTVGATDNTAGMCGGSGEPDVVYQITRSNTAPVTAHADPAFTDYDSVLHARKTCLADLTELACSNMPGNGGELVSMPSVQGGVPFYLYVDGTQLGGGAALGNYGIELTP